MSRTVRKRKRKANLTPYIKTIKGKGNFEGREGSDKYRTEKRSDRLLVKNANRSKKKGVRQQVKKELKEYVYFEESWNQ